VKLPLLLSVPHAGIRVPPEAEPYCILQEADIIADGDEGAAEIFWPLEDQVEDFITTDVARAIVDLNRAEDDFRKDGVIKTHTCWDVPVYREPPPADVAEALLARYHRPYHRRLDEMAREGNAILAVDCHTMAAIGPPVGPDTGQERPAVCLGNVGGTSLPKAWSEGLLQCFREAFAPHTVTLNEPFSGGYITRSHASEMPWLQLELSRGPYMSNGEKTRCVLAALRAWCAQVVET
jgi:N-formylglutamate deformylase